MKSFYMPSVPLLLFCILIAAPPAAQVVGEEEIEYFRLNSLTDSLLLGGALLLNAGDIIIEKLSEPLDTASTISTCGILLTPAVLLAVPGTEWLTIGIMYAESIAWAWGLKELGKNLFHRNRPYTYFNGFPREEIANGNFQQSFRKSLCPSNTVSISIPCSCTR